MTFNSLNFRLLFKMNFIKVFKFLDLLCLFKSFFLIIQLHFTIEFSNSISKCIKNVGKFDREPVILRTITPVILDDVLATCYFIIKL